MYCGLAVAKPYPPATPIRNTASATPIKTHPNHRETRPASTHLKITRIPAFHSSAGAKNFQHELSVTSTLSF
jgi:hypothetical protein